ncbi:MAG: hypothetical protein ACE5IH_04000 [Thermodesulfobacteriota bacterium]
MRKFIVAVFCILTLAAPILAAGEDVDQEEREIIEMLDLLEEMEFLNDMELFENIELIEALEPLSEEGGGE